MHLLNTLPQRLDPGATPTFAGLIAPSLTSPAATPLTLGTGSFGTALTVASATGDVSISSTTAGSSGAGALVVQGGISAGQSAQASYFGGSISFPSDKGIVSSVNDGRLFLDGSANQNGGSVILYGSAHGSFPAHTIYAANTHIYKNISGTQQLSLSLTAATFAGAVTSTQFQSDVYRQQSGDRSLLSFSGVETALGSGTSGDTTKINANGVQALRIDASLLATFAGAVTVSGTGTFSGNGGIVLNGATKVIYFGNPSADYLFFDGSNLITRLGSVDRLTIASTGAVRFHAYGAGAATFDSSGNITSVSDARLKNITGTFTKGLAEIVKLTPKLYTWKPETGLVTDDINATLIAQDLIAAGLPEAVSTYRTVPVMEDDAQSAEDIAAGKPVTQHAKLDADGKAVTQRVDSNYSVSDRTVIAALVNAVKELKAEIDALKAK